MKTTIAALMLLISTSIFGHEAFIGCNVGGRVKVICTGFGDGDNRFLRAHLSTGVWSNGSPDSTFELPPSNDFIIYVPQPDISMGVKTTFQNTDITGFIQGDVYEIETGTCRSLGLKWGNFKIEPQSNGTIKAFVTVFDVENVNRIEFRVKKKQTEEWVTKAIIFPLNLKENTTYSATFKL